MKTDAVAVADAPLGEPHHRHIAYDSTNKQVFLANRAMNRVEVYSTVTQMRTAQISIPAATSAEISADDATVWIGSAVNEIAAVDPVSLAVKARYSLTGLMPIPNVIFDRPVEVLSLSSGKALIRLRQPTSQEALLALWDPILNVLSDLTSAAPAAFQQGLGVMARSGDHSKVIVAANDASGELAAFDAAGNVIAGPLSLGAGTFSRVAANNNASHFATVFSSGGSPQVLLLDGALHQVAAYPASAVHGIVFSLDGTKLYVDESISGASFVTVLDGQSGQLVGRVPDVPIQGIASDIEGADETQLVFALSNRGISFLDASAPGTVSMSARPSPRLQACSLRKGRSQAGLLRFSAVKISRLPRSFCLARSWPAISL